jgi:hypothetical protein
VLSVDIENMREEGGSSNDYNMMYDDETGWLSHFGIQPAPVYKNDSPHRSRLSTTKYNFFLFVCLFIFNFFVFCFVNQHANKFDETSHALPLLFITSNMSDFFFSIASPFQ